MDLKPAYCFVFIAVRFSGRVRGKNHMGFSQIRKLNILAKAIWLLFFNPSAKADGNELQSISL